VFVLHMLLLVSGVLGVKWMIGSGPRGNVVGICMTRVWTVP
jgi:hypothetical protein